MPCISSISIHIIWYQSIDTIANVKSLYGGWLRYVSFFYEIRDEIATAEITIEINCLETTRKRRGSSTT